MNINIIDIEASGLHRLSYPLEIAAAVDGQTRSWLIKPQPSWRHWDVFAEALHGLPRDLLEQEGLPARQVAIELSEFVAQTDDAVLYSDACAWDASWINRLYRSVNLPRGFSLGSIYDLLDERQTDDFHQEKLRIVERNRFRPHRAAVDVEIMRQAFSKVLATTATL